MTYAALLRKPETSALRLSSRLLIGEPNDSLEQEADRVADEVMAGSRLQWSLISMAGGAPLQRKCACGGSGECEECNEKKTLQRKAADGAMAADHAPPIVNEVLRSPGQPLDPTTREFFELRFRYDLSRVRIHTDAEGAQSARSVDAKAYTVGNHIAFAAGRFAPATRDGGTLLAHELAHVVQQGAPMRNRAVLRRQPDKPSKTDAQKLAEFKKSKEWLDYKKAYRDLKAADARLSAFMKTKEYAALVRYEAAEARLKELRTQYAAKERELAAAKADLKKATENAARAVEVYNAAVLRAQEAHRSARLWTRIAGAAKAVFNTMEMAVSCPLAETGIGAVGCVHAITSLHADLNEVTGGEPTPNLFQQTGRETAKLLGASDEQADIAGLVADAAGGAASASAYIGAPRVPTVRPPVGEPPSVRPPSGEPGGGAPPENVPLKASQKLGPGAPGDKAASAKALGAKEAAASQGRAAVAQGGFWRGRPVIQEGNAREGWIHIDARHVTGNAPEGAGDLFAPGTTRAQLQEAAETIVDRGTRISDPSRRLQTFERRITINGKSDNVRVTVDTADGRVITIFPVRGGG
jgi:hypothetical protein